MRDRHRKNPSVRKRRAVVRRFLDDDEMLFEDREIEIDGCSNDKETMPRS